jgi:hypothetical protein
VEATLLGAPVELAAADEIAALVRGFVDASR